ncbi:RNA methyltransferase [Candidatus Peregrinibacteria bacterium]|nr:RNA methyltransferase [Candidatus Peregrinibacteria bacterium]
MIKKLASDEILKAKPSIERVRKLKRMPIYIIADNIRSLYNVGAIFRTSDGILAEKIYLCGMTGIPPRREIQKTSLGACEVVPWEYRENSVSAIKELKKKGVQIVALELTHSSQNYADTEFEFPCALIVGHEINGINDEIMQYVDKAIDIPMLGRANSLNVATAFGIAAYQILHKYKKSC